MHCSSNDLFLFLADGQTMNDDLTLRDYGHSNITDVYCILDPADSPKDIVLPLISELPFLKVKVDRQALMQLIVEQHSQNDKCHAPQQSSLHTQPLQPAADCEHKLPCTSKEDQSFMGMRKGFLTKGAKRKPKAPKQETVVSPAPSSLQFEKPETVGLGACPNSIGSAVESKFDFLGEGEGQSQAKEKVRQSAIPENMRTGRVATVRSELENALALLQTLLKEALANKKNSGPNQIPVPKSDPVPQTQSNEERNLQDSNRKCRRCAQCGVKVGLTAITCRCGGLYCAHHRYAETHQCSFDYKAMQRSSLEGQCPVVVASKLAHRI
mmetsp:Transcript_70381/g.187563  ORF Transcript_70381/g.187563 Transcript_70381/m.187563 type:complete len:325 (+) Transcript_70381:525-1499(+)